MTYVYPTLSSGPPPISLDLDSPELAATYERVGVRQFEHGKLLVDALRLSRGERVLDVGCGTGMLGAHVAALVAPEGEVVGIDPLPHRVDLAAHKHPRFRVALGRAEDLRSLGADRFDAAYLNSVLHWIADKPRALEEVARVLKPAGRIAVNSADAERAHQSGRLVREALLEEGLTEAAHLSALSTTYRLSAEELYKLLRNAGFVHVQVQARTFVDDVHGADDVFAWSRSSSFGNFLAQLDEPQLARVRKRLSAKLEQRRADGTIKLERYLIFATGQKLANGANKVRAPAK